MRCSNCGKDIPFSGNVCPWCNADKSGDQTNQVFMILFGLIGGGLGYAVGGPVGGFIGVLIGGFVGLFFANK
ncbi:hypothetical protein BST27_29225 [Mycobacterium intermedium]|uniref:Zinc ribbon domain-containing protein n=1 Tax=Mycobacterium intermedium TaxID=28445 RepID=A0A1E3S310_MYCIE|nr:hypothetical protein BHQ20_28850 [Mycobacterium intermedium]ORA91821.1 hypothetical protein BST27_29225 [Mycobacterium intermedium]